jgi:hypothetical protein
MPRNVDPPTLDREVSVGEHQLHARELAKILVGSPLHHHHVGE